MLHQPQPDSATNSPDRRISGQPSNRILGAVIGCTGAKAVVSADLNSENFGEDWTVSRFLTLVGPKSRIVGMLYNIELPNEMWQPGDVNRVRFHVELVGEVVDDPVTGEARFNRGISAYPRIGSLVHRIRANDLVAVYRNDNADVAVIGTLSQNAEIKATISVSDMLSKHFAIVGSTGVGKSSAVSLLVRKALDVKPGLRVMILDPHNEFAHAFPDLAVTLDSDTLKLPYWLFKLEELAEVLFRGRERIIQEIELLRELIPLARAQYRVSDSRMTVRKTLDAGNITADTPIPYRMADLMRLIQDRAGQLDNKEERPALRMLRLRLEAVLTDPRYAFMFGMKRVEDSMQSVVSQIYRVPLEGRPIACIQLAGLPAEVVNSVASVLARLAFDMAMLSRGQYQILVLAEEAHRYLPTNPKLGFEPTRLALARIAKEGRKYGCYLGCITQRPGELDQTILSQCSTVFAMRLANEEDQRIIGRAIGDTSASNLAFLPTMAQREAIAFGEGVSTPMRLMFEKLAPSMLPATAMDAEARQAGTSAGEVEVTRIIHRMRNTWLDESELETVEDFENELSFVDPQLRRRATDVPIPDPVADLRAGRRLNDPLFRPFSDDKG
jgi:uncharacterized protein